MNTLVVVILALGIVVIAVDAKLFLDVSREIGNPATALPGSNSALTGALARENGATVWNANTTRLSIALGLTVAWFALVMFLLIKRITLLNWSAAGPK